jgi:ADP-heptose:LPS heptosyltransferase
LGLGDQLMATGMARGARARGKRIAFGDGRKIIWDHHSEQIFRGNPNIAPQGSEGAADLEWIEYYRGHRLYNRQAGDRWEWNYDFHAIPGEVALDEQETAFGRHYNGRVLIEPNVPEFKTVAPNKQWPVSRYREVAMRLMSEGSKVAQFCYPGMQVTIAGATQIKTPTFRHAIAVMARSALYIGPEGGLHHAAAAVGLPAVVLFGGFIPPSVTGYATHTNLTGGADACGSISPCEHCRLAMKAISVADVMDAARQILKVAA